MDDILKNNSKYLTIVNSFHISKASATLIALPVRKVDQSYGHISF